MGWALEARRSSSSSTRSRLLLVKALFDFVVVPGGQQTSLVVELSTEFSVADKSSHY